MSLQLSNLESRASDESSRCSIVVKRNLWLKKICNQKLEQTVFGSLFFFHNLKKNYDRKQTVSNFIKLILYYFSRLTSYSLFFRSLRRKNTFQNIELRYFYFIYLFIFFFFLLKHNTDTILCNYDSHFRVSGVKFISLLLLFLNLIHEPSKKVRWIRWSLII